MNRSAHPAPRALRHRLASRAALLVLAATLLGTVTGSVASADTAAKPPPEPPAKQRFALTPTGADPSQPGERSSFQFHLQRGHLGTDRVTVFNYGSTTTTFHVYANDAVDTAEGQLDLKRSDQKPTDAGGWVHLDSATVTLAPLHAAVIPFVVEVPIGARAGDHAAGIIAAVRGTATTPTGQKVAVESRIGVPLFVRVAGHIEAKLSIVDLQTHYHHSPFSLGGGALDVTWLVVNTGSVLLGTNQTVDVDAPFGWNLEHRKGAKIPELIPGASVAQSAHFTNVLPALRLSAEVTLHPFDALTPRQAAPPAVHATTSFWAIPWILVLFVAVIVGFVYWRWKRRRTPRPPAPAPVDAREDLAPDASLEETSA